MPAELPSFRYHPWPLDTDSAVHDDRPCEVCGTTPGILYEGPVYGKEVDALCFECITTGRASEALAENGQPAEFTDIGVGVPAGIPADVLEVLVKRTPGFHGHQQEHWIFHCDDAAAYMGRVGYNQLLTLPPALACIRVECEGNQMSDEETQAYLHSLHPDGDVTAYWFQCVSCGADLAYSDAS